ncbi:DUF3343 domain-containing protein [Halanaerobaculum tunisiense]
MTEKEVFYLVVFNSTHHALQAEEILKENNQQLMMVPVPPEITADCGLAIKLDTNNQKVINLLEEADVDFAGYYKVIKEGLEKKISNLMI